jgi:carbon starvation protein
LAPIRTVAPAFLAIPFTLLVVTSINRTIPQTSSKHPVRIIGWTLVALLGATSVGVLAWSRGEPVNALWMVVASLCVFAISYRFHSAWLMAKVLTVDDLRATPAQVQGDGRDFVKTNKWVVFGHHFAAIAGPGPLVGPVLAAQFGYLPGMLWMLVGATLGGAVHDSVVLFCSTRRGGISLGKMIRHEVGPFAGGVALVSIVAIMIILLAVLALVVVKALAESPWGLFTIAATMPIAIVMGLAMKATGHQGRALVWISLFGVVALLASVWAGQFIHGTALEQWLTLKGSTLAWWIMGYGFLASVLPVWLLLAPRDYLSTFMKIGTVFALGVAVILLAPTLKMPALTPFIDGSGPVFITCSHVVEVPAPDEGPALIAGSDDEEDEDASAEEMSEDAEEKAKGKGKAKNGKAAAAASSADKDEVDIDDEEK